MRMIPRQVTLGTPSDAERKLFKLLSAIDLGAGEYCLHSLELSRHRYQQLGEVDFIIVGPSGLILLEVKGGAIGRYEGLWTFRNRWGQERRENRGPIKQVEGNMWSLLDRLKTDLGIDLRAKYNVGFGVAFPDIDWNIRSAEWEEAWILDRRQLQRHGGLKGYLLRLYAVWADSRGRSVDPIPGPLVTRIVKALRPEFDVVPSLGLLGERIDARLTALTENQYEKLDFIESVPRALIEGGAGSGKTMLAVHVARTEAVAGHRVLLVCHSPVLRMYLDNQIESDRVVVRTIDDIPDEGFDVLIVDEGQDLLHVDALVALEASLPAGLAGGRWRIFFDPNNQAGVAGRFEPESLEMLIDFSSKPLRLTDNCRNTVDIVECVRAVTGADTGVSAAGRGPDVIIDYYTTPDGASAGLSAFLEEATAGGVDPGSIAILSPRTLEMSSVGLLPSQWKKRVRQLTASNVLDQEPGKIVFSQVADFKGLERQFVAVVDIESIDDRSEDLSTLYVALTRPRAGLYISLHEDLRDRMNALMAVIALIDEESATA